MIGKMNLGKTGPITVSNGFSWQAIDPAFFRKCLKHTSQTNNGRMIRKEIEHGPELTPGNYKWLLARFWVISPTGEAWIITFNPETPRHYTMVQQLEQEQHVRELEAEAAYFASDPQLKAA